MKNFNSIEPGQINDNTFRLIGTDWMLITAGAKDSFNTMTASWGGMGVLWDKNVCFIFIRPHRYTYEFAEKNDLFTLSFFEEKHRDILKFCGSNSGRNVDKISKTGLTVVETGSGSVAFNEARIVIECRKIYYQDINPSNFIDPGIEKKYPTQDYHRMYIGEIISCNSR